MRNTAAASILVAFLTTLLPALAPTPAEAQLQPRGFDYRVGLAPWVRLQGFTRLGAVEGTLSAARAQAGPAGTGRRMIEAEVRAQAGIHRSLTAEWRVAGPLVVQMSGGHQSTTMEVAASSLRVDGSDPRFFQIEELGRLGVWTGSLGLERRFGRREPVVRPYVGVGLGAFHWTIQDLTHIPRVEEIVGDSVGLDPVSATLPAGEVPAGVELPLSDRFRLRLEVSDHVSRNPLNDDDFRLGRNFEAVGRADDWVHAVRGGVGLRVEVF